MLVMVVVVVEGRAWLHGNEVVPASLGILVDESWHSLPIHVKEQRVLKHNPKGSHVVTSIPKHPMHIVSRFMKCHEMKRIRKIPSPPTFLLLLVTSINGD
jgi:hypothetical protein